MSAPQPQPERKDRTPIYIAIIGAVTTIIAAFIAISPSLLNRNTPTPTPAPTQGPTVSARIDFVIINSRSTPFDFYIDNEFQATIPNGGYNVLRVLPGEHTLTDCPVGIKPSSNATACETATRGVSSNPYDWQLKGEVPASSNVLLFLLNQVNSNQDIYVDGTSMTPVDAHQFKTTQVQPGKHTIQSCNRGIKPVAPTDACGAALDFDLIRNVEMFVVNAQ